MHSFLNKAVVLSNVLHILWFVVFFAYIFGFIRDENLFLQEYFWIITPIYGVVISIIALTKKIALVPAIMSIILSICTFLLWSIVLGINQF
ncbi:hypothetical protein [Salirhabdus sp. Marseille-P4669]|uniref:hypothetical protein n=1 Tax=Salirhabdus sp. Marseille-P4669 TaxID=2042310 RepID=UPI000C7BD258|nr:hypothetical protein [Salirhabdus sp. Marseille-P4669]